MLKVYMIGYDPDNLLLVSSPKGNVDGGFVVNGHWTIKFDNKKKKYFCKDHPNPPSPFFDLTYVMNAGEGHYNEILEKATEILKEDNE